LGKYHKKRKLKRVIQVYTIWQVCPTLLLPIDCSTQFISNPNQTHLKQQIKVFRATWKLKPGVFNCADSHSAGAGLGTPSIWYTTEVQIISDYLK